MFETIRGIVNKILSCVDNHDINIIDVCMNSLLPPKRKGAVKTAPFAFGRSVGIRLHFCS